MITCIGGKTGGGRKLEGPSTLAPAYYRAWFQLRFDGIRRPFDGIRLPCDRNTAIDFGFIHFDTIFGSANSREWLSLMISDVYPTGGWRLFSLHKLKTGGYFSQNYIDLLTHRVLIPQGKGKWCHAR